VLGWEGVPAALCTQAPFDVFVANALQVARMLGLDVGGGGGRVVEELAREGDDTKYPLPVPMFRKPNCDFSFAGLKTAVRCGGMSHAPLRRGVS